MAKNKIDFICVQPIVEHAKLIMEWRNDPQTLKMSFHQEPKKWDSFFDEFRRDYFSSSSLPPLFALHNNQKVAFIRFRDVASPIDNRRLSCDISINVAPEYRGKGLGHEILKALQSWASTTGYDELLAEIKEENKASHKLFLDSGFEFLSKEKKVISDSLKPIPIRKYILSLKLQKKSNNVLIIAEAGSNWHLGEPKRDLAMGKALIDIAVDAGANAVKFQTYRPESVYVPNAGSSNYLSDTGVTEDIFDIFAELAMPDKMIAQLAAYCKKKKISFMSTPFSPRDFKVVDPYVSIHKLASYENNYPALIDLMAKSGKPTLISTGASTEEEIAWAVNRFRSKGGKDLTLLQCTAKYPADASDMNLRVIPWLKKRFDVSVGLSDHSLDATCAPLAAVALGATVVEKHFTISRNLPGPDHQFALEPKELCEMVRQIRMTEKILGNGLKDVLPCEEELYAFAKRGVQAIRPISKGELFKEGINIAILRAGNQKKGVNPRFLDELSEKKAKHPKKTGQGIQQGDW